MQANTTSDCRKLQNQKLNCGEAIEDVQSSKNYKKNKNKKAIKASPTNNIKEKVEQREQRRKESLNQIRMNQLMAL